MIPRPTSLAVGSAQVGGQLLAQAFRMTAAVRGAKPLHPKGALLAGTLTSDATMQPVGVPWLDQPGRFDCQARLSRSAGLATFLPDVIGLAVRWEYDGSQCDLLFAGTGMSRAGRFVLTPRRSLLSGPLTTLFPLRSPRGPLLFAAIPSPGAPSGADPQRLALAAVADPLALTLACASAGGPWTPFGSLQLTGPLDSAEIDPVVRFAPVASTPVGLAQYEIISRLRGKSYAGARQGFVPRPQP